MINYSSHFPIHNIPFGIFSHPATKGKKRLATIIGEQVIDLYELAKRGYFQDLKIKQAVFAQEHLNDFISLGKEKTNAVRGRLQVILRIFSQELMYSSYHVVDVTLHMPIKIGDYTDFYSSQQHAYNVGVMFRDPAHALLPNWKHMPVGYHGRASSIFVSGTDFHRPKGQVCPDESQPPHFTASRRLDIELEMATVIGRGNGIGQAIDVDGAEEYVFGFLLFNDWSARDIQKWEYVPLGPFLGKNFFSSVSPWVVTAEALVPFRVTGAVQDVGVLPYLDESNRHNYDINLEVRLIPKDSAGGVISRSNFRHMYWSVAQQIAHHTVNGCNLNVGDLLASGTISGNEPGSYGSMLEMSWGGKSPIVLEDGSVRSFVEDGDTVVIMGYAEKDGIRVGFGEVRNMVLPAL
jgi:fumarylacetoacetase